MTKLEKRLSILSSDTEDTKQTQILIKLLGMKTTMSEMKNILDGINSTLNTAEEKISELQDKAINIIQNETNRKKRLHGKKRIEHL